MQSYFVYSYDTSVAHFMLLIFMNVDAVDGSFFMMVDFHRILMLRFIFLHIIDGNFGYFYTQCCFKQYRCDHSCI